MLKAELLQPHCGVSGIRFGPGNPGGKDSAAFLRAV